MAKSRAWTAKEVWLLGEREGPLCERAECSHPLSWERLCCTWSRAGQTLLQGNGQGGWVGTGHVYDS